MTQPPSGHHPALSGTFPSVPKQVFRSEYFTVFVEERTGIVRSIRSDKPFASIEEFEAAFEGLIAALDEVGRERYSLLTDTRAAPGRNDPQFEAALHRIRPRWFGGFRKVGVLVQSAVGVLQVKRYIKQDAITSLVTTDEDELLKFLTRED